MASGESQTTPVQDQGDHFHLPFEELEDTDFRQIRQGPRISSSNRQPQAYYGPVTIRNYIAGFYKKSLRQKKERTADMVNVFRRLPVELKLAVLEHVHPIDLYHVSQVNKDFRALIMSGNASGVWRTAFLQHPDLPKCPPGVAASEWAFMLFSPGICGICNHYGALTDLAFGKRYCEVCMRNETLFAGEAVGNTGNTVPNNHLVFSLVPRSSRINGLRHSVMYSNASNARFIKADVKVMLKKITLIQLLVEGGVPVLPDLFEEYKMALMTHIDGINQCAEAANQWAIELCRQCSSDYDALLRENTSRCKQHLVNLGHDSTDVNYVQYSISQVLRTESIYKLTPRAFRRVRLRMEQQVTKRKEDRLKQERQQLLEGIYADYQKSLSPDSWQYLPPKRPLVSYQGFSEFVTAKYDKRGDLIPGHAAKLLPGYIADWTTRSQREATELLPPLPELPAESFESKLRRLDLVTSVLSCTDCQDRTNRGFSLIGWNNICRHLCATPAYYSPCDSLEFNERLSTAAASLVSCAGLNSKTATWGDMDALNARFLCGNCQSEDSRGIIGMKTYTWMECLNHTQQTASHPMHDTPAWLLLTPEATRFVREHECPWPHPSHKIWICGHCAVHYPASETKEEVSQHARNVHLIKEPVAGVDIITNKRRNIPSRKQFRLGLDPAYEFRCLRCPELPIYKLWEMQALNTHLCAKHNVLDPVEATDWAKVKVIAAAAAAVPPNDQEPN